MLHSLPRFLPVFKFTSRPLGHAALAWESRDVCFQLGSNAAAMPPRPQGRIDVHIAVLDCVDEAPAIKRDTCIEAYVDVGFGDVASKDECSAGPLRGCVAVAQSIDRYAQQISRRQKAGEQMRAWCAPM